MPLAKVCEMLLGLEPSGTRGHAWPGILTTGHATPLCRYATTQAPGCLDFFRPARATRDPLVAVYVISDGYTGVHACVRGCGE